MRAVSFKTSEDFYKMQICTLLGLAKKESNKGIIPHYTELKNIF